MEKQLEYARTNNGNLYIVRGRYERGAYGEICVQLGDFHTGEFCGEEWERYLKIGSLLDVLKPRGLCEWSTNKLF